MKSGKLLFPVLLTLCLSAGSYALAEDLDLADTAEAIQKGKIDVGKQYDMNKKKGRFHLIHSETLGLECEACHVAKDYAPDYLLLDRENARKKALGKHKGPKDDVVDRAVCMGCHKTNGVATTWYQTADQ